MIDKNTRTNFSTFTSYFEDYWQRNIIRWNTPNEADIASSKAAGIDPFFDKQAILAAEYCRKNEIPFVTVDEKPEHPICKVASVIAVSTEHIRGAMPEYNRIEGKIRLIKKYAEFTDALIILTGGGGTAYYGRDGVINEFQAYKVDVVSTLGAGDTFKAGCIYSLLRGYNDFETVRFASALAAVACTKFPIGFNPPSLPEVEALIN
jgi:sugar/nucleoside kinase (ribokinase family)